MNETIFLGECPIIRPEGIYYGGRRVIRLGLEGFGLGDVGDLLAYRQEWEPFIAAHLNLWQQVNTLLESIPEAQKCPAGIISPTQLQSVDPAAQGFCVALSLSRQYISPTDPAGILPQWNAWAGKSSADIVAGASAMLAWLQEVVMRVGGSYKDDLVKISTTWGVEIALPDLPSFSTQQEIIARIEGAYITTKGVIEILGYGVGEVLSGAATATQAVAQGLTDTVKAIPKTVAWLPWVLGGAVVILVGGALIYYVPRRTPPAKNA